MKVRHLHPVRRHFLPVFLLGGALLFAHAPLYAQGKKSAAAAPASGGGGGFPLPLLVGAGIGGLVIGAALGAALKKTPPPVAETPQEDPAIFDDATQPLAIVDNKERIVRANAAWNKFFGVADSTGQPLPPFLHPDDLAPTRVGWFTVFDGDNAQWGTRSRFFRPDGTMVTGEISFKRQGEERKPSTMLVSVNDATALALAQKERDGAREAIRALYEVISGEKAHDMDAKMRSLLEMGVSRFELPIATLGRFSNGETGEVYETLFVISEDRRVRPALTFPLPAPPSLEARLVGLDKWPGYAQWQNHPFLLGNDAIAFLGAVVVVEGKPFGMLSFASLEHRERDFGESEVELLQLMAEWVGGEIERENARVALQNQQRALLEANDKLEALATHDPLTEAKNRRAFDEKMAEEWSRSARYGTELSLVLLDVDKFKSYNDSFGHSAGDEVLKKVALTIMAAVRGTDFFARYGGEEFVLILPNTDQEGAYILAERLRARVEGAAWKERPVTASFGIASAESTMKKSEDLLEAADKALYYSKERGRNRVTHVRDMVKTAAAPEAVP